MIYIDILTYEFADISENTANLNMFMIALN